MEEDMDNRFKDMAIRIVNAETSFISTLQEISGCTEGEAYAVMAFYLKNKMAKLSAGVGAINVTHGAYLEPDVIRRAIKEAA